MSGGSNQVAPSSSSSARFAMRVSHRLRDSDKRRVLDESTRQRRLRKMMASLEADNSHDDPHADLVMSKRLPRFEDGLLDSSGTSIAVSGLERPRRPRRSAVERQPEYYAQKYRKSLQQLIDDQRKERDQGLAEGEWPDNILVYGDVAAPASQYPAVTLCAVCGFFSNYVCVYCGARVCKIPCFDMHYETRCVKWLG